MSSEAKEKKQLGLCESISEAIRCNIELKRSEDQLRFFLDSVSVGNKRYAKIEKSKLGHLSKALECVGEARNNLDLFTNVVTELSDSSESEV